MMLGRRILTGLAVAAAGTLGAGLVAAADDNASKPGPSWAEFKALENEVREQRQMVIQLMQTEQQRYDMLLRLLQNNAAASASAAPAASAAKSDDSKSLAAAAPPKPPSDTRPGAIEGKVKVPGGDTSDLYVYVDNYRGPRQPQKYVEIKQENKTFVPRVAVVPVGATVSFPNLDPIFHNVFSNSGKNSFDLGSYRAGDKSRAAVFNAPGVVDIYCNMHQRMSAHVLVVPSRLYTRVKPDGSFRLDGVPAGTRSVVAWSPSLKPALQKIDVGGNDVARVSFEMEYTDQKSHSNKLGQPYGSYKE
jgi:plastocyanin